MREWFLDVADIFELVFLEPFRYGDEIGEIPLSEKSSLPRLVLALGSLSLAVGSSLLSPPYTIATFSVLVLAFLLNMLFLRLFVFFFAICFDFFAQKKGRTSHSKDFQRYLQYALAFFVLFAPVSILLSALGSYGTFSSVSLLFLFLLFFSIIVSRGGTFLYDLKARDSLQFTFMTMGLSAFFPFVFNLYSITSIFQAIAGGP